VVCIVVHTFQCVFGGLGGPFYVRWARWFRGGSRSTSAGATSCGHTRWVRGLILRLDSPTKLQSQVAFTIVELGSPCSFSHSCSQNYYSCKRRRYKGLAYSAFATFGRFARHPRKSRKGVGFLSAKVQSLALCSFGYLTANLRCRNIRWGWTVGLHRRLSFRECVGAQRPEDTVDTR